MLYIMQVVACIIENKTFAQIFQLFKAITTTAHWSHNQTQILYIHAVCYMPIAKVINVTQLRRKHL